MRIETRYGYLIDALRRYPFDKEIKERIEEITFPYQNFDENWFIKSKSASNTPEALKKCYSQGKRSGIDSTLYARGSHHRIHERVRSLELGGDKGAICDTIEERRRGGA